MEQCWDADPSKRPADINTLLEEIRKIKKLYYQTTPDESNIKCSIEENFEYQNLSQLALQISQQISQPITNLFERDYINRFMYKSKVYYFEDLLDPLPYPK